MISTSSISEVATLVGEPARTAMLLGLMDGRSLTASELAYIAGVTPQTASGHLSRLTETGLIAVHAQGRHRYHKLASPRVAALIESLMRVAAETITPRRRISTGPKDAAMREARTCYDHIAGRLGVDILDAMVRRSFIEIDDDGGALTGAGFLFLQQLGIDAAPKGGKSTKRFCCPCLDWSERRLHLGGQIGAAIFKQCLCNGWIARSGTSRALIVTPKGDDAFRRQFGFDRHAMSDKPMPSIDGELDRHDADTIAAV